MPVAAIAPFIGPIVGGVGSIIGGAMGSSAASKAASVQQQAAQQAAQQLMQQLGIVNPQILSAAQQAGVDLTGAAGTGAAGITDAATAAGRNLTDVATAGAGGIGTAAGGANAFLNPYIQGGAGAFQNLAQLMAPGGDLNRTFTAADMKDYDPGYQFRIDQANKALQSSAAAKGAALGGGALRALDSLTQNVAAGEYGNAFARFTQGQQQRFNQLNALAQTGLTAGTAAGGNLMTAAQQQAQLLGNAALQTGTWQYGGAQSVADLMRSAAAQTGQWNVGAAQQTGQNTLDAYRTIADLMTGGAAAQAGGIVGGANAWNSALGGFGNAATNAGNVYQQQQWMDFLKTNPYLLSKGGGGLV